MLTELGDWLVEGFEAGELRMFATLPQVQPGDAARIGWRMAQAKYPPSDPDLWSFRCHARGPGGVTLLRLFFVIDGVLEPADLRPSWRPSFVDVLHPGGSSGGAGLHSSQV